MSEIAVQENVATPPKTRVAGVLAEYDTPEAVMAAAEKVRDAGYKHWDTHTPFPVHGMDEAMGMKMSALPWIVLIGGITGALSGIALQWWTNAVDYPFKISGKPFFSLPANIPVTFELTILFSAFGAFFGMLALNRLPEFNHPLLRNDRFRRATTDGFFISVESRDPQFDEAKTSELLRSTSPAAVESLEVEERSASVPWALHYVALIVTVLALVPPAIIVAARASTSTEPRIHPNPNMDFQPKIKAQRPNPLFADQRGMRLPVPGTVARGELRDDDHFFRGVIGEDWAASFPSQVPLTMETMRRGEERFSIFCTACHGRLGDGQGMVHQRAVELGEPNWRPPTSLHDPRVRQLPVGQLFHTITNGIRNMPAYGSQISDEDRWAILLYVRALQRSRNAEPGDVPEDVQLTQE